MSTEKSAFRRTLMLGIWLVIALFALGGIWWFRSSGEKKLEDLTGSESHYKTVVSLRLDSFSGYSVLRSDHFEAELRSQGIKLVIEDDKADYSGRLEALENGDCQFAVFTVDSKIKAGVLADSFPGSIVLVLDESRGADAIIAYKDAIPNLRDASPTKGFVATPDSPSEYLARVAVADLVLPGLPSNWLKDSDKCNGAAEVLRRFQNADPREQKAYILWEPYVSIALKDPRAIDLLNTSQLKGHVLDVLVVEREYLTENQDIVSDFVRSYLRSSYHYGSDAKMVELVREDAEEQGESISKSDAENLVQKIWWKNTMENYAHFALLGRRQAQGLEPLEDIIAKIADRLERTGAFGGNNLRIDPNKLYYDGIMSELQGSNFHPGQRLGDITGVSGASEETVRGYGVLPELSDSQWTSLMPVAQMKANRISFRRGSPELNSQAMRTLDSLGEQLKSYPQYYVVVLGTARGGGNDERTLELARARADAACQYLIRRVGIGVNRVRAEAKISNEVSAMSVRFQLGQRPY